MTLYEILGISKGATKAQIKSAFRAKAMKLHPDVNGGEQSDEFLRCKQAYDILTDDQLRAEYDETGHIPNEEKSAKEMAVTRLAESFAATLAHLIEKPTFMTQNPITIMADILDDASRALVSSKADVDTLLLKLQGYADRFKIKNTDAQFFVGVVDNYQATLEQRLVLLAREADIMEMAQEILEGVTFDELVAIVEASDDEIPF